MPTRQHEVKERGGFRYVDEGPSTDVPPVVLLHGMLGHLNNWSETTHTLAANDYRVIVPLLPVYHLPLEQTSLKGLVNHVHGFLDTIQLDQIVLVGNSLGGQIAIMYALAHPWRICTLVLTGSSGLYEVEMGTGTPQRQNREFVRERTALTFFDSKHVTEELVDDLVEIINDRACAIRLIRIARSAKRDSVAGQLGDIDVPTLLIWGRNDFITPPEVAEDFRKMIPRSELHFIDQCGHAPMIEHPKTFNRIMLDFLHQRFGNGAVTCENGTSWRTSSSAVAR